jgi:hypothetical protein
VCAVSVRGSSLALAGKTLLSTSCGRCTSHTDGPRSSARCQQILNRFLFRRELFAVEHKKIGAVLGAETLEPRQSKSGQSILAGYHKAGRHLPHLYAVHNRRDFGRLRLSPPPTSSTKSTSLHHGRLSLDPSWLSARHVGRWRRRAPLPVVRNWGWNFSEPKPSLTEFSACGGEEIASMRFPCVCGGKGTCGGPREARASPPRSVY